MNPGQCWLPWPLLLGTVLSAVARLLTPPLMKQRWYFTLVACCTHYAVPIFDCEEYVLILTNMIFWAIRTVSYAVNRFAMQHAGGEAPR